MIEVEEVVEMIDVAVVKLMVDVKGQHLILQVELKVVLFMEDLI